MCLSKVISQFYAMHWTPCLFKEETDMYVAGQWVTDDWESYCRLQECVCFKVETACGWYEGKIIRPTCQPSPYSLTQCNIKSFIWWCHWMAENKIIIPTTTNPGRQLVNLQRFYTTQWFRDKALWMGNQEIKHPLTLGPFTLGRILHTL